MDNIAMEETVGRLPVAEHLKRANDLALVSDSTSRNNASPILKLPSELLLLIFTHAVYLFPSVDDIIQGLYQSPDQASISAYNHLLKVHPFVLSSVCSLWRDVAFRTPAIWSNLTLSFPREMVDEDKCALLEAWLGRTRPGTGIVLFDLEAREDWYRRPEEHFSARMVDALAAQMHRCTLILLLCHRSEQTQRLLDPVACKLATSMPLLNGLVIDKVRAAASANLHLP